MSTGSKQVDTMEMIKGHEGLRLKAYQCTAGVWTIGYGHTQGVQEGDTITVEQANRYFDVDFNNALCDVIVSIAGFRELSHNRQAVLIDMCFNLGITKLKKFKITLALIKSGQYYLASKAMLQSKWAKQVGQRAITLSKLMRDG